MYKEDALLKHTRAAAHKIMAAVTAQPKATRAAVIRTALDTIRPGLFQKVERIASGVVTNGGTSLTAYEEALRLALADEMVASVQALGKAKLTGRLTDDAMRAQRIFYRDNGSLGLGDTGDGLGASVGTSIAKFGESLLRNAACSPEVNAAIMGQVTNDSGRAATSAGLSVAAGISQCGRLPGQLQTPAPPPPAPAPPPPPAADNTMTYVLVGAAVLGVGAIAFLALRKPKAPPAPVTPNRGRRRRHV
jgi:hypothetical protein